MSLSATIDTDDKDVYFPKPPPLVFCLICLFSLHIEIYIRIFLIKIKYYNISLAQRWPCVFNMFLNERQILFNAYIVISFEDHKFNR